MAITGQFHKIIFFSSLVADFPIPSVCEISWAVLNSADFMSGFICQKWREHCIEQYFFSTANGKQNCVNKCVIYKI
jgi:hypothetical protein